MTPVFLFECLSSLTASQNFCLGYSGGVDSTVLLHLLANLVKEQPQIKIRAIHINHQLNAQADKWQTHCQQTALTLGIPLDVKSIHVDLQTGESLEAKARTLRYNAFSELLKPDECLLTAHNQNDQAETVLLQLLRGAGVKGLSAMPLKTKLKENDFVRPLLMTSREEIQAYADQHQLKWIEDVSNTDLRFDRNFLRQQVTPIIEKRWPRYVKTFYRSAKHCAETAELLDNLAKIDYQSIKQSNDRLAVDKLIKLPSSRGRNLLRYWLHSKHLALPNEARLAQIYADVLSARWDAQPVISWPGGEIRRYRNHLYAMRPLVSAPKNWESTWDLQQPLELPANLGKLVAVPQDGLNIPKEDAEIIVRFRRGGEKCLLPKHAHHKSLKHVFQEWGVPPWERDRIPLVFVNGELVVITGLVICKPCRDWKFSIEYSIMFDYGE